MFTAITTLPDLHIQYNSRVPSKNLRASRATLKSLKDSMLKLPSHLQKDPRVPQQLASYIMTPSV